MTAVTPAQMRARVEAPRLRGPRVEMIGKRFGRLVPVEMAERAPNGNIRWICECDCGARHTVMGISLRTGGTMSCGCLKSERARTFFLTHGATRGRGERSRDQLYLNWCHIKTRCINPNRPSWPRYGGRGITVHAPWMESYEDFRRDVLAGIGPRPEGLTAGGIPAYSLDRINNDGNYEPGNIRWATQSEQGQNTVRTKLTLAAVAEIRRRHKPGQGGNTRALAEEFGVCPSSIRHVVKGISWRSVVGEQPGGEE